MNSRMAAWFILSGLIFGHGFGVSADSPPLPRTHTASAIDRLSGFDASRITAAGDWLQRPNDPEKLAEIAKLLYQVNRMAKSGFGLSVSAGGHAASSPKPEDTSDQPDYRAARVGDSLFLRGRAVSISSTPLPAELAEVLEFDTVYHTQVLVDEPESRTQDATGTATRIHVLSSSVPRAWLASNQSDGLNQQTSALGVVVLPASEDRVPIIAASSLAWLPTDQADSPSAEDWALLARHGFDLSLIEAIRERSGKPLVADDQVAFYELLRAADQIGREAVPAPPRVDAGKLLREASQTIGRRIQLPCQSIRITRVGIDRAELRERLGSDHYWQIDALGDLGNLTIRIDSGIQGAEPAVFENRFPISIVALRLPAFFEPFVSAGDGTAAVRSDVALVSRQLLIDGFFYRLWAYENDRMGRLGNARQIGPLIMASNIADREPLPGDLAGVDRIGYFAAFAAVLMLVVTCVWLYRASRADAIAQAKRRASS